MRTIGNLDTEPSAALFSDVLTVNGIENQIESEEEGGFSVWVINEDQTRPAAELLIRFRADPAAAEFQRAPGLAKEQRQQEAGADNNRRSTVADTARVGYEQNFAGFAMVPVALLVACVAAAILTHLGENHVTAGWLKISNFFYNPDLDVTYRLSDGRGMVGNLGLLSEVRAGQVWRLITPIFLHFGAIHLLFNAMWLRDLGTSVENRFGGRYLLLLILAIAIPSNLGQLLVDGPNFGGMSGVNYGLFGFLWIRGRFDRSMGWELNKNTVTLMLVWFVACFFPSLTGLHVANTVHAIGLLIGMAWGYLSAKK